MRVVHRRFGEILRRMEAMAARFQAGTLRRGGVRRARAPRVEGGSGAPEGAREGPRARIWPGQFGWLVREAAWEAAGFGLQLRTVLETPEMVALLAACPQAVRVLTPLCRALAIETAVLRPGLVGAAVVERVKVARVRVVRVQPDLGRVPIPRGVMAAVRRERVLKR